MAVVWLYTLVSVIIVSAVSLVGIFTLSAGEDFMKKIILFMVSFAAGTMLGNAFLEIFPEILKENFLSASQLSWLMLMSILFFFLLEKVIHWRHCHIVHEPSHPHPVAIMNLIGDFAHNIVDGMMIAASYLVDVRVGVATSLAVFVHEIPQEIGDFSILIHGGFTRRRALLMNFLSATGAIIGASAVLVIGGGSTVVSYYLLPFAAAGFIYMACADLFPELHKESGTGRSLLQIGFLALGIALIATLTVLME